MPDKCHYQEYRKSKSSTNKPSPSSKDIKKVKVNLFGAAGPSAGKVAKERLDKSSDSKSRFYHFDFKTGQPLEGNGRFVWVEIEDRNQMLRFSTISSSSHESTMPAVQAAETLTKPSSCKPLLQKATGGGAKKRKITDYMKPCKKRQMPAKRLRMEEPAKPQPTNEQTI